MSGGGPGSPPAPTVRVGGATSGADPDAGLVEAVRHGDQRALDELLRRHQPRLWAVCRRMTGSDADADDAAQEALVAIVRGLPAFDGRARFGTWAYRIAVNASLDELRRRRRRPDPGLPGDDGVPGPEPVATDAGPESAALTADVDAALRRLPPEFRAAVVLRDLCGLDYAEIAEVLGLPPGTVRSRISRGRAALAPLLAPGNPTMPAERPTSRP
ncbi:MAG: sigma-70 family RNA polymerase sigma factor [Acidimicrobiales bacterium]